MPEGPEVETIRRGLEYQIVGEKITAVDVLWAKSFPVAADVIEKTVVGALVAQVSRRAKVLIVSLSNDFSLLFHLKMTGQMVVVKAGGERFAGGWRP